MSLTAGLIASITSRLIFEKFGQACFDVEARVSVTIYANFTFDLSFHIAREINWENCNQLTILTPETI